MACKCGIPLDTDLKALREFPDAEILRGVRNHYDPAWWQQRHIAEHTNRAYLRRWGTYLRREARRRGLL